MSFRTPSWPIATAKCWALLEKHSILPSLGEALEKTCQLYLHLTDKTQPGWSPPAGQLVHGTHVHYFHNSCSQQVLCEHQGVVLIFFSFPMPYTGTHKQRYPPAAVILSPSELGVQAELPRAQLRPSGLQGISVQKEHNQTVEGVRNLEISDLERKVEAMYLPAPASKEELSQELFSWEHGLKEIKFLPSLKPDGPQTHLLFKDMCVILGINMSTQNRSCAISVA